MKKSEYTRHGREIHHQGLRYFTISKGEHIDPVTADAYADFIVKLLNKSGKGPFDITSMYMRNGTGGRRNMAGRASEADEIAAHELAITTESNGDLYKTYKSISVNLANKKAQGKYDRSKAVKAFEHFTEAGARAYEREALRPGEWNKVFNKATRKAAAEYFVEKFEGEYRTGAFDKYLTKVAAKAKAANPNRTRGKRRAR